MFISKETVPDDKRAEMSIEEPVVNGTTQLARNRYRSEAMNDLIHEFGGTVLVIGGGSGTKREIIGALKQGVPVGFLLNTGGLTEGLENEKESQKFVNSLNDDVGFDVSGLLYCSSNPIELANMAYTRLT